MVKDERGVVKELTVLTVVVLVVILLVVTFGVLPEARRIRQALERAWPSNAQIEALEPR